jgi:hypothetical protein
VVALSEQLISEAKLASRTLAQLADMTRQRQTEVAATSPTLPRALPIRDADGPLLDRTREFLDQHLAGRLSGGFLPLIGECFIDVSYVGGVQTFDPPLSVFEALERKSLDEAAELDGVVAPVDELESVKRATVALLRAIARLHEYWLFWLEQLTPESGEDGSWQRIWGSFIAGAQAAIDELETWFAALLASLKRFQAGVADLVHQRQPTRRERPDVASPVRAQDTRAKRGGTMSSLEPNVPPSGMSPSQWAMALAQCKLVLDTLPPSAAEEIRSGAADVLLDEEGYWRGRYDRRIGGFRIIHDPEALPVGYLVR